ncbi:MAG: hypothetical protein KKF39_05685, partial [Nanoarchaeota archaeon]|nr:hypothetical protein [Nanoarchaeota archaeon]
MKKSYPEYRKLRINKEQLYNKLTNAEKKIVDDFISYCAIGSGQNKLNDIKANILQFRDIIEKPFKEINLKDLRDYLVLLNK